MTDTIHIVKGKVTCDEAHEGGNIGDTEWQFSDGPPGERGSSADYLSLEEGLKAHSGKRMVFHDEADQILDSIDWEPKAPITALADECYPLVHLDPLETTHAQRTALFRKWKQGALNPDAENWPRWADFAKTAQPTSGMDGAIVVQWCGMWLAIEKDGYTHS